MPGCTIHLLFHLPTTNEESWQWHSLYTEMSRTETWRDLLGTMMQSRGGSEGTLANQRHKSQAVSRGQCLTIWIGQATTGREGRENPMSFNLRLSGPQSTELESQLGLRDNAPTVWQMTFSSKLIQMAFWFLQPNNPQAIKEGQRENTE